MLVTALAAAGCGSGRRLAPVTGEVQLQGKPLAGGLVTFMPVSTVDGTRHAAVGETDAAGKFQLTTYDRNDGAMPGEYKVTIEWTPPPTEMLSGDGGFEAMRRARLEPTAPPAPLLHENYRRFDKTPLKATVPTRGALVLQLNATGT